ncbi:hypothetical protein HPB48_014565 [Haemaphysalis longicornis]|uniref:Transposase n=1 Tax=Haemaphysalis longicornis TaxID=44386 RepID=A0A9J6FYT3_HAELO|nr:hypothetical protein HPB48_014565 [Haemaphysalis longicornis]
MTLHSPHLGEQVHHRALHEDNENWFDMHDTSFGGTGQKAPIADVDDGRLLWLENDFTCYVKKVQASSVASGNGAFTGETFEALLFTTKSTVETTRYLLTQGINYVLTRKPKQRPIEAVFGRVRYMCGGNDMLDARAVDGCFGPNCKIQVRKAT